MNTLLMVLVTNVSALALAMLLKINVSEVYAFLAFNFVCVLFIGFVNLVAMYKLNTLKGKDDDTRTNADDN